ncbi:unnamed protein product, partial [Didymodactylos carnosus]
MILNARYPLYHSDDRQGQNSPFDCLYAYIMDYVDDGIAAYIINYHLVPYCRRLDLNEERDKSFIRSYENVENNITFAELYQHSVTSAQPLSWSAPIDIAERYEKDGGRSNETFYNCSYPWFGPVCQYKFEYDILPSFGDIVQSIFARRMVAPLWENFTIGTCYPFLTGCDLGLSQICLDWREICDGNFDCMNGEDEQLCQLLEINNCSDTEFRCHYTGECIPSTFVGDGKASKDCLDGTDETVKQDKQNYLSTKCLNTPMFQCEERTSRHPRTFSCGDGQFKLDGWIDCYFGEDESFPACQLNDSRRFICESDPNKCLSMVAIGDGFHNCRDKEDELTESQRNILKGEVPFGNLCNDVADSLTMTESTETDETHCEWWPCNNPYVQCNRMWNCLNGADELNCPGIQCSLNEYACYIIIMLIDEQRQIAPYHEQIIYVHKRDCGTKFNIYLPYPHQPKHSSANYSIRIDIFDKITLTYWGSWHLLIPFQFLPVNRIAAQLYISRTVQSKSCPLACGIHGRCVRYINKNFAYFCQCDKSYSGFHCDIQHTCSCSSDSFCLTSSVCVCPVNKFGSQCYLKHSICQLSNNPCENNGTCVPVDSRIALNSFTCSCTENFYGTRCENTKSRIDIEFDEEMIRPISTVFVHYITAFEYGKHQRTTIFKKIMFDQNTITLFVTQPFHILFVKLFNQNYHLT